MITDSLDFIKSYIDLLNESLKGVGGSLTKLQKAWLAFCLTAIPSSVFCTMKSETKFDQFATTS